MSQGKDHTITKDEIAEIVGDDAYFDLKLLRKVKRYGFREVYNQIRWKE